MSYGICLLSVVPLRKEPSSTSEMVTQLLFGEHYRVFESRDGWLRIKTELDHYECWLSEKQHSRLSDHAFRSLAGKTSQVVPDLFHPIHNVISNKTFPISIGALLPFYENGRIRFDDQEYIFEGQAITGVKNPAWPAAKLQASLLQTAYGLLNAPYLWGGRNPLGIDCSGFTQIVFRINGISLPRDSAEQVKHGHALSFVEEAEPGDLAFFDNEEGKIVHVGIIISKDQIIHSSGCVRIDHYDHYGIFHSDVKKYSHHLRVIKRLL